MRARVSESIFNLFACLQTLGLSRPAQDDLLLLPLHLPLPVDLNSKTNTHKHTFTSTFARAKIKTIFNKALARIELLRVSAPLGGGRGRGPPNRRLPDGQQDQPRDPAPQGARSAVPLLPEPGGHRDEPAEQQQALSGLPPEPVQEVLCAGAQRLSEHGRPPSAPRDQGAPHGGVLGRVAGVEAKQRGPVRDRPEQRPPVWARVPLQAPLSRPPLQAARGAWERHPADQRADDPPPVSGRAAPGRVRGDPGRGRGCYQRPRQVMAGAPE
mmetsp:Transcript_53200/g.121243  ORF Transcript_53200/g.121243 Transcript_53200/m.121243 type:complete len:269 (+) Transcript_53200:35-841(+)